MSLSAGQAMRGLGDGSPWRFAGLKAAGRFSRMGSSSGHGSTLLKNFFDKNQNEPFLLMSRPTA
jgi:hypothetical protein